MLSALGPLLPIAVAVAVSTVPIMATILILLSPRRNRSAIPFLIGWVVGMAAVVMVAAFGANALPIGSFRGQQRAIAIGQIVVGTALLVAAVMTWRRATRAPAERGNGWLDRVERMGPVAALGFALALNLRPKALLLGAAAGLSVAGSSLRTTEAVIVLAIYVGLRPPRSSFRSLPRSSRRLGCSLASFWPATGSARTAHTSPLWCW